MNEPGPPPVIEEHPPEKRNLVGWFVLFLLLAFMIVVNLVDYLTREPTPNTTIAQVQTSLQTSIGMSELMSTRASDPNVRKMAEDLRPWLNKDSKAALTYAAVRYEGKNPAESGDLVLLQKSKDANEKLAFEVYATTKLTEARAKQIAGILPPDKFIYRLVSTHALEKAGLDGQREGLVDKSRTLALVVTSSIYCMGLFLGAGLLVLYIVLRTNGNLRPLGHPFGALSLEDADRLIHEKGATSMADADRLAMRAAQYFLGFLFVPLGAAVLFKSLLGKEIAGFLTYVLIVVMIFVLARMPLMGKSISLARIGITRANLGKNILWGVAGAIANIPIVVVTGKLGTKIFAGLPKPEHPLTVEISTSITPLIILKMFILAAVFAPFIEEIMFRGTMLPALAKLTMKPWLAGLISSFLFAAIHPTGIPAWPALAAIGGMSCLLVYQTRSLVPSIVMHSVHNALTLVMALAALSQ